MNIRALVTLVVSVSCVGAGCSSESGGEVLCSRVQACAEKSGAEFSETECKSDMRAAVERADTAGCSGEYEEYMDCVGAIELECSDDLEMLIVTECGAKLKRASACLGDAGIAETNACERLYGRYQAKVEECGGTWIEPTSSDEGDENDSRCEEKVALDAASTFEELPCDKILIIYPAR